MDHERKKELQFLMRIGAVIVTDSRTSEVLQTVFYNDFYTIQELISEGYMEYIGHQKAMLCLRPINNFRVYISVNDGEVRELKAGEIITMSLTTSSRNEFEQWLATSKE